MMRKMLVNMVLAFAMCFASGAGAAPTSSVYDGTNSTSTSTFKPLTSTTSGTSSLMPANSAFVLYRGYYDPGTYQTGQDSGYYQEKDCSGATETAGAYCKVSIYYPPGNDLATAPFEKCPAGFTARLDVKPVNAITTQGRGFACPYTDPDETTDKKTGKKQYLSQIKVSAMGLGDGTLVPSAGVEWTLSCVPNKDIAYLAPQNKSCEKEPKGMRSVLLWDMGSVKRPSNYGVAGAQSLTAHRQCPLNYKPYAVVSATIPYYPASSVSWWYDPDNKKTRDYQVSSGKGKASIMNPSGVCATGVDGKTISYLARNARMSITFDETSLTVEDPYIDANVGVVYWELYCFPPGMDPPAYQGYCSTSSVYFKRYRYEPTP